MTKDEVKDGLRAKLGKEQGLLAYKQMKKIYKNNRADRPTWKDYLKERFSLADVVSCFAVWYGTEQGDEYWRNICNKVR